MTTPQIYVAAFGALCLLVVFAYRLSVWIDRRRQRAQQATLDTVVGEERRLSLFADDLYEAHYTPEEFDAFLAERSKRRPPTGGVRS